MDPPFKNFIVGLCLIILKVHDCNGQGKPGHHGARMMREPAVQPHNGYSYPEYKPQFPFPPPPPPNVPFSLEGFLKHREYEMKFGNQLRKYAEYFASPGFTPPPTNMANPNIEYEVEYPYVPHAYVPPPTEPAKQKAPQQHQPPPKPNLNPPKPHHHSQFQHGLNHQQGKNHQHGQNPQHGQNHQHPQNPWFNQPPTPNQPLIQPQQFPIPNLDPSMISNHQSPPTFMQPPQNGRHWSHQQPPHAQPQSHQQFQPNVHQHQQPHMRPPHPNMHQPQPNMHQPQPNLYQHQSNMQQTQSNQHPHQPHGNMHHTQANLHQQQPNIQQQPNQHQPQSNMHQTQPNQHQPQSNMHQTQPNHHQPQSNMHQTQPNPHQPQSNMHQTQPNLHQPQSNMHQTQPNPHQPHGNVHQTQPNQHRPQSNMHQSQPNPHQQHSNMQQQPNNHHQWNQHQGNPKQTFQHLPFSPHQHKQQNSKSLANLMRSQQNQFNNFQQLVGGPGSTQLESRMNPQQNMTPRNFPPVQPNHQQNMQPQQYIQTTPMSVRLPGVQDMKSVAHRHHPPPSHSLPLPSRHHSMHHIEPQQPKQEQLPVKPTFMDTQYTNNVGQGRQLIASPAAAKAPLEPPSQKSRIPGSIREYIQKPRSNTKGLLLALQKYLMQLTKVQNSKPSVPSPPTVQAAPAAPSLKPSFQAPTKTAPVPLEPQWPLPKAQAPIINSEASIFQIPPQSQSIPASTSLNPSPPMPLSQKVTLPSSFDANAANPQPTLTPKTFAPKEPTVVPVRDATVPMTVTTTPFM